MMKILMIVAFLPWMVIGFLAAWIGTGLRAGWRLFMDIKDEIFN